MTKVFEIKRPIPTDVRVGDIWRGKVGLKLHGSYGEEYDACTVFVEVVDRKGDSIAVRLCEINCKVELPNYHPEGMCTNLKFLSYFELFFRRGD